MMQNLSSSLNKLVAARHQILASEPAQRDSARYHLLKRILDLSITLLALSALWPLCLLIAVLIKLDSPGPVFIAQQCMGARRRVRYGQAVWEVQPFPSLKFRTTVHTAGELRPGKQRKATEAWLPGSQDTSGKPRLTRVGQFIHKTSLDELPQLWNILKGDMSLVGPRAASLQEVASYQSEHYARLQALPGLTGLWQIAGQGKVTFEAMFRLDSEYIRKRTIWLDLWILLRTIPAAFVVSPSKEQEYVF